MHDASSPLSPRRGAIILAAGRGVRMRSALPKVLHRVGGVPMVRRAIQAAATAGADEIVVVLDTPGGPVHAALPTGVRTATQAEPRGTGDATRIGLAAFSRTPRTVVVIGGDTPLLSSETIGKLFEQIPQDGPAAIALAAADRDNPTGYGRVVCGPNGRVERIVEEADATPDQRRIRLVNGMAFSFDGAWLERSLPEVTPAPNGEYYLTALIEMAVNQGLGVQAVTVGDQWEIMGVNTRRELMQAEGALRERVLNYWLDHGVSIIDPANTYVEESVIIGQDVELHPYTFLRGNTVIADGCVIGPGATLVDTQLGTGCTVRWSFVEGLTTEPHVSIGPYARIRGVTRLGAGVSVGSFSEIKNSNLGADTQMHHFGYMGDATLGVGVNVGAGAVTCNFDGETKHETVIGDGAFIGSDTMLVAPVVVGARAATGAGSVVTHDVPADAKAYGVPARIHASPAVDPGTKQEQDGR